MAAVTAERRTKKGIVSMMLPQFNPLIDQLLM